MKISSTAIVSCYLDIAALCTMLLLLVLKRHRKNEDLSRRIISAINIALTISCVASFISHAVVGQQALKYHSIAVASRTIWEWLAFFTILLWGAYVQNKLYGDIRRRARWILILLVPITIFTILLIINLFTGIIFSYSPENQFEEGPLYMIMMVVEAACFMASIVRVWAYDRSSDKIRFLRVMPMLLPVLAGVSVQFFIPHQADVLGFAIGAMLVYFSMSEEMRVLDEESGMYNKGIFAYIVDQALTGKKVTNSALILKVDGDIPSAFPIIHDTLDPEGDVIRTDKNRFLMFFSSDMRSELQLLSTRVEEAVERHNEEFPDKTVAIRVLARVRTGDEDVLTFLRKTAEDQDAGDPVRSVASMISELAQIDNELKLAGDIQQSILPMNFPAFPDRKEFGLYASIDPAKEVGGDFYDFFLVDRDHLALVIADVSGKGVPAALFMMVSKTMIKNQLMEGCDPATTLTRVNKQLCERNSSMMFVTVWLAVIEISTGKGKACNAGHEKPALHRAGKGFELLKYKHCRLVGLDDEAEYENREFELQPGDCVLVYTDGVPEAANSSKEMFGDDRLLECLNKNADKDPENVVHSVREAVDRFVDGAPQFDDITMVCVKYYGKQTGQQDS